MFTVKPFGGNNRFGDQPQYRHASKRAETKKNPQGGGKKKRKKKTTGVAGTFETLHGAGPEALNARRTREQAVLRNQNREDKCTGKKSTYLIETRRKRSPKKPGGGGGGEKIYGKQ